MDIILHTRYYISFVQFFVTLATRIRPKDNICIIVGLFLIQDVQKICDFIKEWRKHDRARDV